MDNNSGKKFLYGYSGNPENPELGKKKFTKNYKE